MNYLYIFTQSCLLEIPFYLIFIKRPKLEKTAFVFAMNSMTHPIVFFGLMNLSMTFLQNILVAEAFAILSESFALNLLLKMDWKRAALASLLANLVSWQLGPVLTYTIWA